MTWGGGTASLCGRTLEETFGLENANWCQENAQRSVGLKLRTVPADAPALAEGLNKRVRSSSFDKTKFALQVLAADKDAWVTPRYIRDGLVWLANQINLEEVEEVEAIVEAVGAV